MNRRVFITRVGVVSPIGNGETAFAEGLAAAKSGIRPFTRFDATWLATKIGGEVNLCDLAIPPEPLFPSQQALVDTKSLLAFNALQQIAHCIPVSAAFFCAVGLERVDLEAVCAHRLARATGQADTAGMPDSGAPVLAGSSSPANQPRDSRGFPEFFRSQEDAPPLASICPEVPPVVLPHLLWKNLGKTGPVAVQVSTCAASTIALGTAFQSIRSGMHDAAVAGGVDSMLFPYGIHAFNSLGALSERNDLGPQALSPFDAKRSGTLLGEGAAFLLLESEASLERSRNTPVAEIKGFGASMDACHPVMPDPQGAGLIASIRAALQDAALPAAAVDYVNAHGTGTHHNDLMETAALYQVFGERAALMPVSSVKPFFGHLLTAAGAIEVATCLTAFTGNRLPPTLHFSTPDPGCRLDVIPNQPRAATVNLILKNSSGFGGQNASLLLARP
jgi:3-oxoacyl-[acyl-carrier-protein] synthase II